MTNPQDAANAYKDTSGLIGTTAIPVHKEAAPADLRFSPKTDFTPAQKNGEPTATAILTEAAKVLGDRALIYKRQRDKLADDCYALLASGGIISSTQNGHIMSQVASLRATLKDIIANG